MSTTVIPPAATPSISELRTMLADPIPVAIVKPTVSPVAEVKAETPEVVEESKSVTPERGEDGKFVKKAAGSTETEAGTVPVQDPEVVEEKESPLPEAVQKRIAKEVKEQARIDREIAEHVSRRKAKQAELDKIKADTGTSGSEPVTTTAPAKVDGKPVRPTLPPKPVFGAKEGETLGEYYAALDKRELDHEAALVKFETERETWMFGEAERIADRRLNERQYQERFKQTVAEAEKAIGKDFDGYRQRVVESTPEGLQVEIGALGDAIWPKVVAHLGDPANEAEMTELAKMYERSPSAAIRQLGRIEDRLTKLDSTEPAKVATPPVKPLPPPPARVGGGAAATPKVDLNKVDMRTFKREIASQLSR